MRQPAPITKPGALADRAPRREGRATRREGRATRREGRARRWAQLSVAVAVAVLMLGSVQPPAQAQNSDACDPGLQGDSKSPLAYRMRGSRCEGEFVLQVNNSPDLQLVSLVEHFDRFDADRDDLLVQWSPLPENADALHLRVSTWKPKTYYRMDARLDGSLGSFHWPANVLAALGHTRDDLVAAAWTYQSTLHRPAGEERFPVYHPLRLRPADVSHGTVRRQNHYQIGIYLARRAEEVYVTLEPIDPQGHPGIPLQESEALGYDYYPANSITELETPELTSPGLYRLLLSATQHGGTTATKAVYFHHSTPTEETQ